MPRRARKVAGGLVYHVLNRGNGRQKIFYKEQDYLAFLKVLGEAQQRYAVETLGYCLMPNHWHLVVRPMTDEELGRWMRWVGVTHVRRHHEHYHRRGGGHLYQGRYKSFVVQEDRYFLTLMRYVEGNALRAKLVTDARLWRWSSLVGRKQDMGVKLSDWPVERPRDWAGRVNEQMSKEVVEEVRVSVKRGRPFGEEEWVKKMVRKLGVESSVRAVGRPKKRGNE